ncbi:MAG: hypothetical protein DWQ07_06265 [Chloroflexi bacterium]|nr:MAG: hypothetical protein DWQ07_06265 [Chloroflexota bacterium]MBL1195966.1 hypothetical protein [Chloroflexota bacterium]
MLPALGLIWLATACNANSGLSEVESVSTALSLAGTMMVETGTAAVPTHTETLTPTLTNTVTTTPTITLSPTITLTPTLTPIPPTPTTVPGTMVMYMVQLDTGGPIGCGDSLIPISVGVLPTGDPTQDLFVVMTRLFTTKVKWYGTLYNPLFASNVDVVEVTRDAGPDDVLVSTVGRVVKGDDYCDWDRIRAQVNTTARQNAPGISIEIELNGGSFNDRVSSDRVNDN